MDFMHFDLNKFNLNKIFLEQNNFTNRRPYKAQNRQMFKGAQP